MAKKHMSPNPQSPGDGIDSSPRRLEAGCSGKASPVAKRMRSVESGEVNLDMDSSPRAWMRSDSSATADSSDVWDSKNSSDDDSSFDGESALTFKDIAFSVRSRNCSGRVEEKTVLEPVSGHFGSGTLAAIMGPSGSGKTTLVDILANKKTSPYSGVVHFNGRPRDKLFSRMTAYVPQHDVMPAYQTVKEAVLFQSSLKEEWPRGFTADMASQRTDKRLKLMGLYEVRDSRIGDDHVRGISGGQRRRLSLARGIASGARILFCDEPTSGLSATDAETCVRQMRMMADRMHMTIVVVIHQPRIEVAELFDHLLLLTSYPGRAVYNGPMAEAVAHFEKVIGKPMPSRINPMDYCMDVVTPATRTSCQDLCVEYYAAHCRDAVGEVVERELENKRNTPLEILEDLRRNMLKYGELPPVRNSRYGVRRRRQFWVVWMRTLTLSLRDRQGIIVDFVVAFLKAVVIGIAYLRVGELNPSQQCGFFFMVLMSVSIEGMKNMPKIIGDRTIMKMEVSEALYSEWAYIFAFTTINWVQTVVSNGIYVFILFYMSGLDWAMFWDVFGWTTFLAITMDSCYLMLAAIAKDSTVAFVLSLPFLMLFMLYNGFTATKTTVPDFMRWAIEISPVAHAMEAVVMKAAEVYQDDMYVVLIEHFGYVNEPRKALEVMACCFLLFRTVQMVCLKNFNNIQR